MRATVLVSALIGIGVALSGVLLSMIMSYAAAHFDVVMVASVFGVIAGAIAFTWDRRTSE